MSPRTFAPNSPGAGMVPPVIAGADKGGLCPEVKAGEGFTRQAHSSIWNSGSPSLLSQVYPMQMSNNYLLEATSHLQLPVQSGC